MVRLNINTLIKIVTKKIFLNRDIKIFYFCFILLIRHMRFGADGWH